NSEPLDTEEQNNISVYHRNIGSVVNVTSRVVAFDFFYGLVPQEGQGSGFIIDRDGHVLTNYHVIAEARQVEVTLHNRKKYRASVVGTDRSHDLAIIQIKAPDLNPMVLGDSRNLQVGQNAGIGFAIPINTAKAVLNDLLTLGRVRRPALGVVTLPISPDIADQLGLASDYGLLIVRVVPGGAAERAGLKGGTERAYLGNMPIMIGGDLIVALDGQEVQDQQQLSRIMNNHRAGDTVKVTIYRGKRKMEMDVTLG